MSEGALLILAVVGFVYALTAARLDHLDISGPALFVLAGIVATHGPWAVDVTLAKGTVGTLAEVTLALVLFSDASRINVGALRRDTGWPVRLLAIGLPLTMAAGFAVAVPLLGLPWQLGLLLGAALAPTDAALSASLIADERVPERVRRALNVESGLNDGLATPVVLFMIAASAEVLGTTTSLTAPNEIADAVSELGRGVLIGVVGGLFGAVLLRGAKQRGWTNRDGSRLACLTLAFATYLVALAAGGNGFVATFVAGVAFAAALQARAAEEAEDGTDVGPEVEQEVEEDTATPEVVGTLLSLTVWYLFGAVLVVPALEDGGWRAFAYAALSLTLVRMVPVAASMVRSRAGRPTTLFLGWFGPRGLASVVFALLIAESLPEDDHVVALVTSTITITVLCSVIAHGVTASPLTDRYTARLRAGR